jgi:hypothetical protein
MSAILTKGIDAVRKSLTEFGYSGLTSEQIAEAHRKYMAGEPMSGIVEMMAEGQFKEYPEIFGEPA